MDTPCDIICSNSEKLEETLMDVFEPESSEQIYINETFIKYIIPEPRNTNYKKENYYMPKNFIAETDLEEMSIPKNFVEDINQSEPNEKKEDSELISSLLSRKTLKASKNIIDDEKICELALINTRDLNKFFKTHHFTKTEIMKIKQQRRRKLNCVYARNCRSKKNTTA